MWKNIVRIVSIMIWWYRVILQLSTRNEMQLELCKEGQCAPAPCSVRGTALCENMWVVYLTVSYSRDLS